MNRVDTSNPILRTGSKPVETQSETLAVSVDVQPSTSDIAHTGTQGSWREYANHRIRAASLRDRATTTTARDDLLSREDRSSSRRAARSGLSLESPSCLAVSLVGVDYVVGSAGDVHVSSLTPTT